MICIWKTNSTAPCACAYALNGPIDEILGHLRTFGRGTMVIKQNGLSMARFISFGACEESFANHLDVLSDQVSGLETRTDHPWNAYLLTDSTDPRPLLALGEPGKAIDLSIRLDGHAWQSPAVIEMIRRFKGTPLGCQESHRLGAGAWLDEWEESHPYTCDHVLANEAKRVLTNCGRLDVEVKTLGHRSIARFVPSFIDADGSVLRIADRNCQHVVFVDAESPFSHLTCLSESHFRIARNLPSAS